MALWRAVRCLVCVAAATISGAGCGVLHDPASPSTTSAPTETFTGTLATQGSRIFTFTTAHAGSVSVTLSALDPSVPVGLGLGTSSGTSANACTLTTSTPDATAGSAAQITVTMAAGSYCVKIYDSGNVTTTATFTVGVSHS